MTTLTWAPPPIPYPPRTVTLTPRQADVLTGIVMGLSNPEIARRLVLSEETVSTHVKRLFKRIGIRGRAAVVRAVATRHIEINVEVGYVE